MNRRALADSRKAIKLADGSYLIRSGCCQPAKCAPSVGYRCCRSARCDCDWPKQYEGWAPVRVQQRQAVPGLFLGFVTAGLSAGIALCAGLAWFVAEHAFLILTGAGLLLALGLGTVAVRHFGRRHGGCTTTITHHH